ncbi:hypothetical protein Tcur_4384 [Thermomonospora curvata DSM 43183]|uniref:Helix-hairpin-helix domain-containing protein n=1 Tax=Thermomonospora curvata (strain ATCC 19995 / DSM 43183 / JCM 3096 / KCTC 9072 / NBRC 15933 / NCIMB 10081 / Henssen B9) TaxID=471852 RepID=D1A437_THECD|nr:hypothetical protein Tcur_4384 [Thermomonospora curvata DSM 43183]
MAWPGNQPFQEPPQRPVPGDPRYSANPSVPPAQQPLPVPSKTPPHPQRPQHKAASILWASLPLISVGTVTPFAFIYAAFRRRTVDLALSAAAYLAIWAVAWVFIDDEGTAGSIAATLAMLLCFGGTVHAFAVRKRVFSSPPPLADGNEQAVQAAQHRRKLRERARKLAAEDPVLARELGIGRPDQPRSYDDGGLIDVNHAPPHVLATLPGVTPELAARIDRLRRERGPFVSVEELAVDADLPAHLVPTLGEYTIFLP